MKFLNNVSKVRLIRITSLVAMFTIFVSGLFSVDALSRDYIVIDSDTQITTVRMIRPTKEEILKRANVTLGNNDIAVMNEKEGTVTVKRAFDVTLNVDGVAITMPFNDGSVGYALNEFNCKLGEFDKVEPSLTSALTPNLNIYVTRCVQIVVKDSGTTKLCVVPVGTVNDALKYLNITLGVDDKINLSEKEQVKNGTTIEISRIGYHEKTVTEKIPYASVSMQTDELPLGTTVVDMQGSEGEKITTYLETYVNGVFQSSEYMNSVTTIAPVNEVILVGTGESKASHNTTTNNNTNSTNQGSISNGTATVFGGTLVDHNGNNVEYQSVLTGSATAYTAPEGAITSTGRVAQYGLVAVNPNIIPYGSKLYICSPDGSFVYGYAIAADTGGALMDGSALVDCYYPTEQECINFGRRQMCVYIIG